MNGRCTRDDQTALLSRSVRLPSRYASPLHLHDQWRRKGGIRPKKSACFHFSTFGCLRYKMELTFAPSNSCLPPVCPFQSRVWRLYCPKTSIPHGAPCGRSWSVASPVQFHSPPTQVCLRYLPSLRYLVGWSWCESISDRLISVYF